MAYMDEKEVPAGVDVHQWGTLEGNSGNEGYSSKVAGVMNAWGALIDYKWIQKGDPPLFFPVRHVHLYHADESERMLQSEKNE